MGAEILDAEVELDGLRLAYREYGPADGLPVLCLHGWLDNAASFAPLADELPALRLIAPDLAGHGQSDHRAPSVAYHYLDWVVEVIKLADELRLSRFVLLGHSMGAGIAALAAGTWPDRVAGLVLLEGSGPRPVRASDVPRVLAMHWAAERKARGIPWRNRPAAMKTAVRARMVSSPLSRRAAELLAERGTRPVGDGVIWSNDRRLSRLQPAQLSEEQILIFLGAIRCPTLHVEAVDGIHYNAEIVGARKAAIRDYHGVMVPGQHHVHMDDATTVAAHVGPFLGGLSVDS